MTAEQEVDHILDQRWQAFNFLRRRSWAPILCMAIFFYLEYHRREAAWTVLGLLALTGGWLVWPLMKWAWVYREQSRSVVLWVRRFHRGNQSRQYLRLWGAATEPWGQVITFTDEAIRRPFTLSILVIPTVAILPLYFYWIEVVPEHFTRSVNLGFAVFFVSLGVLGGFAAGYWLLRQTVLKIRNTQDIDKVVHLTERIRNRTSIQLSGSTRFIRCARDRDDLWRAALSKLAPQVAVVILDYAGEITSNIEWELRTLLQYCAPERIVIAMAEQVSAEGHAITLLEPHGELCRIVGVSPLPQVFVYANRIPITTITSKYEAVVRPAQRIIGIAALTPVNQRLSDGSLDSPEQHIH